MRRSFQLVVLLAAIATVAVGVGAFALMTDSPADANDPPTTDPPTVGDEASVEQFDSDAAFEAYVAAAQRDSRGYLGGGRVTFQNDGEVAVETADAATNSQGAGGSGGGSDTRISDTNVQVQGVAEPDRLQTGQRTLYYADGRHWGGGYVREDGYGRTRILDASDPAAPVELTRLTSEDDLGRRPLTSEVGPDSDTGYVFTPGSNDVTVVDIPGERVTRRIDLGGSAYAGTWDPAHAKLYVPVRSSDEVAVIDHGTGEVTARIDVGARPYGATAARVRPALDGERSAMSSLAAMGVDVSPAETSYCIGECACGHRLDEA